MAGLNFQVPKFPNSDTILPRLVINFYLSENEVLNERYAYTLMILIGDIGGFTGAIIWMPTIFFGWYSNKMFAASIY